MFEITKIPYLPIILCKNTTHFYSPMGWSMVNIQPGFLKTGIVIFFSGACAPRPACVPLRPRVQCASRVRPSAPAPSCSLHAMLPQFLCSTLSVAQSMVGGGWWVLGGGRWVVGGGGCVFIHFKNWNRHTFSKLES